MGITKSRIEFPSQREFSKRHTQDRNKRIFFLLYEKQMTVKQVAKILNLSANNIYVILHRLKSCKKK